MALQGHMHPSASRPTTANRAPPAAGHGGSHAGSGSTVQVEAQDLYREPLIGSEEDRNRVTGAHRGNGTWVHVAYRPASSAAPSRHPPPLGTLAVPTPQKTTCNHTKRTVRATTLARTQPRAETSAPTTTTLPAPPMIIQVAPGEPVWTQVAPVDDSSPLVDPGKHKCSTPEGDNNHAAYYSAGFHEQDLHDLPGLPTSRGWEITAHRPPQGHAGSEPQGGAYIFKPSLPAAPRSSRHAVPTRMRGGVRR